VNVDVILGEEIVVDVELRSGGADPTMRSPHRFTHDILNPSGDGKVRLCPQSYNHASKFGALGNFAFTPTFRFTSNKRMI
jgi:hypothetical protein